MENDKIKHLEFIQNVITRMNTNSFQIKSWAITILSASLALFAASKNICFILICIFPTILFWCCDAYVLLLERKFRRLFNDVALLSEDPKEIALFEMNPNLYLNGVINYLKVLKSKTILWLYLTIIVFLILVYIIIKVKFINILT